jgi:hypothetical protein
MKRLLPSLALLAAVGCATSIQKGDRCMARGQYVQAERHYTRALHRERAASELPKWQGKDFTYRFRADWAARAIRGLAEARRAQGDESGALYHDIYFTRFALRHGMPVDAELVQLEQRAAASAQGAAKTTPAPASAPRADSAAAAQRPSMDSAAQQARDPAVRVAVPPTTPPAVAVEVPAPLPVEPESDRPVLRVRVPRPTARPPRPAQTEPSGAGADAKPAVAREALPAKPVPPSTPASVPPAKTPAADPDDLKSLVDQPVPL